MSKIRQAVHPFDEAQIRTFGVNFPTGNIVLPHADDWHQLIYASQGVMTVHTDKGSWVVPSHRAAWVPAGIEHRIEMIGPVAMRTLYVSARLARSLPVECCVVNVSPLLRELILRAVDWGALTPKVPAQRRLIGVILDELKVLRTIPLQLPKPADHRALRLAEWLRANPAECDSLDRIVKRAGASRRTIERLFQAEAGMSFGQWKQRLRLLHALQLLAAGEPVTTVALEVGYNSTSAFIAMFKRALGTTPSRYFS